MVLCASRCHCLRAALELLEQAWNTHTYQSAQLREAQSHVHL